MSYSLSFGDSDTGHNTINLVQCCSESSWILIYDEPIEGLWLCSKTISQDWLNNELRVAKKKKFSIYINSNSALANSKAWSFLCVFSRTHVIILYWPHTNVENESTYFPVELHHLKFPSTVFQFLHILTYTNWLMFIYCFIITIPDRYEMISHYGFDLYFPGD